MVVKYSEVFASFYFSRLASILLSLSSLKGRYSKVHSQEVKLGIEVLVINQLNAQILLL